jgi:uncharacterized protein (DUF924 family)
MKEFEASWTNSVLHIWFSEIEPLTWFRSRKIIDETIRTRFRAIHEQVVADFDLAKATASADLAVASVIVLDQFPRNMFRGISLAFATDHFALAVTRKAIETRLENDSISTVDALTEDPQRPGPNRPRIFQASGAR